MPGSYVSISASYGELIYPTNSASFLFRLTIFMSQGRNILKSFFSRASTHASYDLDFTSDSSLTKSAGSFFSRSKDLHVSETMTASLPLIFFSSTSFLRDERSPSSSSDINFWWTISVN